MKSYEFIIFEAHKQAIKAGMTSQRDIGAFASEYAENLTAELVKKFTREANAKAVLFNVPEDKRESFIAEIIESRMDSLEDKFLAAESMR